MYSPLMLKEAANDGRGWIKAAVSIVFDISTLSVTNCKQTQSVFSQGPLEVKNNEDFGFWSDLWLNEHCHRGVVGLCGSTSVLLTLKSWAG